MVTTMLMAEMMVMAGDEAVGDGGEYGGDEGEVDEDIVYKDAL